MPSRLPKSMVDNYVGGMAINDALRNSLESGNIYILRNGDNPPTVKGGSRFWVYGTDTYTPPNVNTGNNAYPGNTAATYLLPSAVFEGSDRTFAWNTGGLPAKSNSTQYYLYCSGVSDTVAGQGSYGVSTNAPTFDYTKGGYYSADGRVIATFYVTSGGVVSEIGIYPDKPSEDIWHTVGGTGEPALATGSGTVLFRMKQGIVTITGTWTVSATSGNIFTIPLIYRPSQTMYANGHFITGPNVTPRITLATTGVLSVANTASGQANLFTLTYII